MDEAILKTFEENPISPSKVHELTLNMNTVDIADVFERLSREKTIQVFRLLPKSRAADVFSYIVPEKQQIIVEALTDAEVGKIMDELFVDDAVDFIEEMPANVVKRVLKSVGEDTRRVINQLLQYPEDSAGSIMTTEYVDLREDATVREAFDVIRSTGVDKETIYTCYVIRRDKLLVGVVSAKALLLAGPQDRVGELMDKNPMFAHTTDDQETVADLFRRYGLLSLPVVDKEQRLVGIVTVDDVVQIIEEEYTEDIEIMGALNPSEEPYLKTKVLRLARNRIVWLMVLMLSATLTSSILAGFEDMLLPALTIFIPMLMGTGGNAGSQASTLVIRGMAVGEIELRDILRVFWREVRVGLLCALALGLVNYARIYLMHGQDAWLALTVTISLMCTVLIAKTIGCTLPILAKRLKIDPALMAAPIITTLVDAASLTVYFAVAQAIMRR
jgi:magnesium transporter